MWLGIFFLTKVFVFVMPGLKCQTSQFNHLYCCMPSFFSRAPVPVSPAWPSINWLSTTMTWEKIKMHTAGFVLECSLSLEYEHIYTGFTVLPPKTEGIISQTQCLSCHNTPAVTFMAVLVCQCIQVTCIWQLVPRVWNRFAVSMNMVKQTLGDFPLFPCQP